MSVAFDNTGDLKRRIRKLKRSEIFIRTGNAKAYNDYDNTNLSSGLVWDEFFDLHEVCKKEVKYPLNKLAMMDKSTYKSIIDEFYFHVYYRVFKEKGILGFNLYEPGLLSKLSLPFDADEDMIKKRFRMLAKKYHPDAGGDSVKFIELMEMFDKLR